MLESFPMGLAPISLINLVLRTSKGAYALWPYFEAVMGCTDAVFSDLRAGGALESARVSEIDRIAQAVLTSDKCLF